MFVVQEVNDQQLQQRRVEAASQRRCILMFDRSVDLARILEVLALQLPSAFLRGSSLNLTRLVEVRQTPTPETLSPSHPGRCDVYRCDNERCYREPFWVCRGE